MNLLQSQINVVKARIDQYKNSELFDDNKRVKLIALAEQELAILLEKQPNTETHADNK